MKIERIDHLHVRPQDFDKFNAAFERLMGHEYLMNMPMDMYGADVAYEPFPIGVEAFRPTEPEKSVEVQVAVKSRDIFCISYKVPDIHEAIKEMEEKGWKMLEFVDNDPILEALFDTVDDFGFYIECISYPFLSMRGMMGMEIVD